MCDHIYYCFVRFFDLFSFLTKRRIIILFNFFKSNVKKRKDGEICQLGWTWWHMYIKSISDALQINDSRQLQRIMTSALNHDFQMFCHISVDEVCRKIEELLPPPKIPTSYPLTTKKKSTMHTTLKKTNFVQNIKGSCSPCPTFEKENTFHQCLIIWGKILQAIILDA